MTAATIVDIMESWPLGLRLRIEGEAGDVVRDLAEDCEIRIAGVLVAPGDLRVGMMIGIDRAVPVLHNVEIIEKKKT